MILLMNIAIDNENCESGFSPEDMKYLMDFYHAVEDKQVEFNESLCSEAFQKFVQHLDVVKETLTSTSRTAKLWLLYMDCVETVKMFLRGERTGDWNLHLIAVERMLNLLAATGHNNYAKCARLYLQLMHDCRATTRGFTTNSSVTSVIQFVGRTDFGQIFQLT
jgi:hypothetical protein